MELAAEMLVETFELRELMPDGTGDIDKDQIQKIRDLGLHGQMDLIVQPEGDEEEPLNRFQAMTKAEVHVYQTICPARDEVTAYKAGPIPMRVLDVIEKHQDTFEKLEVWHATAIPDPLLIGYDGSHWNPANGFFLLARWGAELIPFEQLAEKARQIKLIEWRGILQRKLDECALFEQTMTDKADQFIMAETVYTP